MTKYVAVSNGTDTFNIEIHLENGKDFDAGSIVEYFNTDYLVAKELTEVPYSVQMTIVADMAQRVFDPNKKDIQEKEILFSASYLRQALPQKYFIYMARAYMRSHYAPMKKFLESLLLSDMSDQLIKDADSCVDESNPIGQFIKAKSLLGNTSKSDLVKVLDEKIVEYTTNSQELQLIEKANKITGKIILQVGSKIVNENGENPVLTYDKHLYALRFVGEVVNLSFRTKLIAEGLKDNKLNPPCMLDLIIPEHKLINRLDCMRFALPDDSDMMSFCYGLKNMYTGSFSSILEVTGLNIPSKYEEISMHKQINEKVNEGLFFSPQIGFFNIDREEFRTKYNLKEILNSFLSAKGDIILDHYSVTDMSAILKEYIKQYVPKDKIDEMMLEVYKESINKFRRTLHGTGTFVV